MWKSKRDEEKPKKKRSFEESRTQIACVRWFRLQYPKHSKVFFSVPNGGSRNEREAKTLKSEGVTSGVSDLILLIPRQGFNYLCIEMKTEKGVLSKEQKEFKNQVDENGGLYVVCRNVTDFMKVIQDYLK